MKRKRKRKHPGRKFFISLLALLLCILFAVCAFFGVQGYQMYQKAIEEKTISERVDEIRYMEGFTPYSELPECYINATISVEDRRFKTHGGIDLIGHWPCCMDGYPGAVFRGGRQHHYTAACQKSALYAG
ncbi:MAG: transglycosylase domain-containing protein [Eubacteriales bacterium]|nr:transglycosylase domain-containing protein [Eubacteriales bacterium]